MIASNIDDTSSQKSPILHSVLRWLAILAAITFAKWASSAVMPVLLGLFIACVVWPLYHWTQQRWGQVAGSIAGLAAYLLLLAGLVMLVYLVSSRLHAQEDVLRQGIERGQEQWQNLQTWTDTASTSGGGSSASGSHNDSNGIAISSYLSDALSRTVTGLTSLGLAGAVLLLVLIEIGRWQALLSRWDREDGGSRYPSLAAAATIVRRYFIVRTGIGLLTGLGVWLSSSLVGLELPLTWGILNFALNYFPTIGSILGIIPPVLLAGATGGTEEALVALSVVGGVQVLMGTVFDPLIQGKSLACSATLVLVVMLVGGWIGGVAGAFLAMPVLLALRCWAEGHAHWPRLAESVRLPPGR